MPLVSVVIPAFNCEATLVETLRCVADQTYRRLEILVVDDGSTDTTPTIAEAFCRSDGRARLLRKTNGGVASARNLGIREAAGDYVAPCDADDLWHPDKIAAQVRAARAGPADFGFVYCWFREVDQRGMAGRDGECFAVDGAAFERLLYRNFVGNGSALLVRRDAALALGGYDERLAKAGLGCEDILFQLRLARVFPVVSVPQFLVGYRVRTDSMSSDYRVMNRSWRSALKLLTQEDCALPGDVVRRNLAWRGLLLAEAAAWRGRPLECARFLALSLARDPGRTLLYLLCRSVRAVTPSKRRQPPSTPFLGLEPTEKRHLAGAKYLRPVQRVDERRMAALAGRQSQNRPLHQDPARSVQKGISALRDAA